MKAHWISEARISAVPQDTCEAKTCKGAAEVSSPGTSRQPATQDQEAQKVRNQGEVRDLQRGQRQTWNGQQHPVLALGLQQAVCCQQAHENTARPHHWSLGVEERVTARCANSAADQKSPQFLGFQLLCCCPTKESQTINVDRKVQRFLMGHCAGQQCVSPTVLQVYTAAQAVTMQGLRKAREATAV